MFSSRKLLVPFFVFLSFVLSLVEAHDVHPSHNMKRFLKKRSPLPQFDLPVAGAGAIPSVPSSSSPDTSVTSTSTSQSSTSSTSSASSESSSASTSASSSVSESSSSTSSSSAPSTTDTHTSVILNLTNAPLASTSTVVPTITRTQSVDAAQDTGNAAPVSGAAAAKGTTFTIIIAVAASIGGAAILWTIFRKWKLSSSKKFDQRLNPITNWQPDATDDDIVPNHRRAASRASSFHSGSGHAHSNSNNRDLEHDFTAGPATSSAPVGGYADLARATSPLPPMQEHLTRGPSFNNRSYDMGVPIHHQGYGTQDTRY